MSSPIFNNIPINALLNMNLSAFAEYMGSLSSEDSIFWQDINTVGVGNFFQQMDTNGNGKLEENELGAIAGSDYNDLSISEADLNTTLVNTIFDQLNILEGQNINEIKATIAEIIETESIENGIFEQIKEYGIDNFFKSVDADKNNELEADELRELINKCAKILESSEREKDDLFSEIFTEALDKIKEDHDTIDTTSDELDPDYEEVVNDASVSDGHAGGGGGGYIPDIPPSIGERAANIVEDEIPGLEAQKIEIAEQYNGDINTQKENLNTIIQEDTNISAQKKSDYNRLNTEMLSIDTAITGVKTLISGYESEAFSLGCEISRLEGEKTSLSTDTDDEDINKDNTARITAIEGEIKRLEGEKETAEGNKRTQELLLSGPEGLNQQKIDKQIEIDNLLGLIMIQNPELQTAITECQSEIARLESEKTSKLEEIDGKIEAKRTEALGLEEQLGNQIGEAANGFGSKIVQDALEYLGYNEGDGSYKLFTNGGSYAWCAAFVTYVIEKSYEEAGKELPEGFRTASVSCLRQWGIDNGLYKQTVGMDDNDKAAYIVENVKPGDAIIFKENGRSHTGIVTSIDDDGTIHTIEGNTYGGGNSTHRVMEKAYSPTEATLSGFVSLP